MLHFGRRLLRHRLARRILGILCLTFALTILGVALMHHNIRPVALTMAESHVRAVASDAINRAVRESVRGITYEDLMTVSLDSAGRVAMLQANSARMNQLATSTSLAAQELIGDLQPSDLSIPLNSALGGSLFPGQGVMIPVKVIPSGSVTSEFQTNFGSAGINQTRHEIFLKLTANMSIAIPVGARDVQVTILVPVAESVIVGEVPRTFTQIEGVAEEALPLVPR